MIFCNKMLVEWPILAGMMIYGRKWIRKVFQNRFAPKGIILTPIDHILNNFQKIDFFSRFFICGTPQNGTCRIFYGSRNFYMMLEKCLDISYLFPNKKVVLKSMYCSRKRDLIKKHINFRSKVIFIYSLVKVLLFTFGRTYHLLKSFFRLQLEMKQSLRYFF